MIFTSYLISFILTIIVIIIGKSVRTYSDDCYTCRPARFHYDEDEYILKKDMIATEKVPIPLYMYILYIIGILVPIINMFVSAFTIFSILSIVINSKDKYVFYKYSIITKIKTFFTKKY